MQFRRTSKLKQNYKFGQLYNSKAIDLFIGKYFAIRACPNDSIDYSDKLDELKIIDERLFEINKNAIDFWVKLDIEEDDILADSYRDVLDVYLKNMKKWLLNKDIR